jgi:hypothetical protein
MSSLENPEREGNTNPDGGRGQGEDIKRLLYGTENNALHASVAGLEIFISPSSCYFAYDSRENRGDNSCDDAFLLYDSSSSNYRSRQGAAIAISDYP